MLGETVKVYLVGGAVRDKLLGITVSDKDHVVVGSTPKQMLQQGFQQVGKDFPVFLHPVTYQEYALARTEKKITQGYTGFSCFAHPDISLEQDLLRRDLTINAIAEDENGKLYDPYNGLKDIKNKILRHVSPAFIEDPLRVLRVARFAARFSSLNFTIAPETLILMKKISQSGELQTLAAERIWQEIDKALATEAPDIFFYTLQQCGALKSLLPELHCLFSVPSLSHKNIGKLCLLALHQASQITNNKIERFAALITYMQSPLPYINKDISNNTNLTFINALFNRIRVPNEYKELAILSNQFYSQIIQATQLSPEEILALFDSIDCWRKPQRLAQLIVIAEACYTANIKQSWDNQARSYLQQCFDSVNSVPIKSIIEQGFSGKDIKIALYKKRITRLKTLKI